MGYCSWACAWPARPSTPRRRVPVPAPRGPGLRRRGTAPVYRLRARRAFGSPPPTPSAPLRSMPRAERSQRSNGGQTDCHVHLHQRRHVGDVASSARLRGTEIGWVQHPHSPGEERVAGQSRKIRDIPKTSILADGNKIGTGHSPNESTTNRFGHACSLQTAHGSRPSSSKRSTSAFRALSTRPLSIDRNAARTSRILSRD